MGLSRWADSSITAFKICGDLQKSLLLSELFFFPKGSLSACQSFD